MRIIGGVARSRRLVGPVGDTTRPMTDRMRESLFSSISAAVAESNVLDLYAGSGAMGLEALSRGATEAVFVERDRDALVALQANIDSIGLGGRVVASDVGRFLDTCAERFDVAFVDPPYAVPLASLMETMTRLVPLLTEGAVVAVHRRHGEEPPAAIAGLVLVDQRRFGGAELWRFRKEQAW
ncbi:MAG: 16S rRNA (guanine(966)-N(2))-methyltransferase RsmD [Acidimicrobiia bacterium]|nr:16S rRNA (guanine(966)-N(2))-methyltransferase RsmD [Acidimicrobiia bacterium]